jgi:hypothetical protein
MSQPPPMRCSFMDPEREMQPCANPAHWACRVDAGPWMLGAWLCDDHKPYFETLLPVLTLKDGGHKPVPVGAMLVRSPLILHLDYLATGEQGRPVPHFTCDRCGQPIVRNFEQGVWQHMDMGIVDHGAIPG